MSDGDVGEIVDVAHDFSDRLGSRHAKFERIFDRIGCGGGGRGGIAGLNGNVEGECELKAV